MRLNPGAFIFLFFLVLLSCNKDNRNDIPVTTKGVYISNEGGYGYGNAEVSFYDPATQQVTNGLFDKANNYMLGDVAQSIFVKDSFAFVVVNNSQKVEVVALPSFKRVQTITIAGSSPRYFQPVNDSIAYVTELYAGKLFVVNYRSGQVVKTINSLSRWTEHMLYFGSYVLVEERNLNQYPSSTCSLVKINTSDHTFMQRYSFNGSNLDGIVKDVNGKVWMAVDEDTAHSVNTALYCLNSDLSVNKSIVFPLGHHLSNLCINGAGDELYFFDDDVKRLGITDTSAPANSFIQRNNRNFYALGVDPVTEEVYVSDALDYIQSSRVYRYDKNGQLVHTFTAGVITGNFAFKYE